jgi:hypothetical protein
MQVLLKNETLSTIDAELTVLFLNEESLETSEYKERLSKTGFKAAQDEFCILHESALVVCGIENYGSTALRSAAATVVKKVKGFEYIDRDSILKESFVEINGRKAYEVIFKQYPDRKAKWVIFLANDREYTIQCYTTEELYDEYEEIFDHVINSFFIE